VGRADLAAAALRRDQIAISRGGAGEVREREGRCCPRIKSCGAARASGGGASLGAGEKRGRGWEVAAWSPVRVRQAAADTPLKLGAAPRSVRFPR
jgi:hypothetical protein